MGKKNLISTGHAGELFVAGELERKGFSVAVPQSNVPTFDLLAIDRSDYSHQIAIQVKTNGKDNKNAWIMSEKNEKIVEDNIFYIFVKIHETVPEYFIVPAKVVSEYIIKEHIDWYNTPGKNNKVHSNNNTLRTFKDETGQYKDRWDLLSK